MTREEREAAIAYIKGYRKLDEDLHNTASKDSISYYATDKCLKYWDMAIQALEKENIYDDKEHYVTISKALYDKLNIDYEALSQEPCCDDAICRKAVLEMAYDMSEIDGEHFTEPCMVVDVEDIQRLPSVTQKPIECEDAISRILKRMWNCRGKHTTSIDKVAMEQIIRDELPSVTQKSGKWITVTNGRGGHECSLCHEYAPSYQDGDEWLTKYCPNCGSAMKGE